MTIQTRYEKTLRKMLRQTDRGVLSDAVAHADAEHVQRIIDALSDEDTAEAGEQLKRLLDGYHAPSALNRVADVEERAMARVYQLSNGFDKPRHYGPGMRRTGIGRRLLIELLGLEV